MAPSVASNRWKLDEKWRKHCRVFFRNKSVAHNFTMEQLDDGGDPVFKQHDKVVELSNAFPDDIL